MADVKERPILFSAPMIRAILAGTKTQTRRALKVQPLDVIPMEGDKAGIEWVSLMERDPPRGGVFRCRHGVPGDRLWVRESFRLAAEADATPPRDTDAAYRIWYEADAPHQPGFGKLRPGMFLPRWASRITLEITGVRVERLQDISEADAIAEGSSALNKYCNQKQGPYQSGFSNLWIAINGSDSWDANPFVWVVAFKRVTP